MFPPLQNCHGSSCRVWKKRRKKTMHFNFMKNVLHYWKDDFDALVFSKIKNSCSVLETSFINTR